MSKYLFLFLLYTMPTTSFSQNFDIQGHRGCRGLMPENSIPAFKRALEIGVTTLELDVVVSKDHKLVVSHEPYFSAVICKTPDGSLVTEDDQKKYNIYQLNYEEIKKYDCGSRGNERFPEQSKVSVYKPLLQEVIQVTESYSKELGRRPPSFNIEIKSDKSDYGTFQPAPKEFCDLLYNEIKDVIPVTKVVIQSFDHEVLRYWKIAYPQYRLALLEEDTSSPDKAIEELGFAPAIYSPYYKLINKRKIRDLYDKEIMVIPWTVNDKDDMKKLVEWGVDGLITDYPDRFKEIFPEKMNR